MPVTESQAARIAAYYEARKPYNKLLFEALDRVPANVPDAEKETSSDEAQDAEPQPGAHFAELVQLLKQSKISDAEGEKTVAKRKL